jgi:hypothetical protein
VDSVEFSEWLQYWELSAEMSGLIERDPTPDEVGEKMAAAFALHNASLEAKAGKMTRERR